MTAMGSEALVSFEPDSAEILVSSRPPLTTAAIWLIGALSALYVIAEFGDHCCGLTVDTNYVQQAVQLSLI